MPIATTGICVTKSGTHIGAVLTKIIIITIVPTILIVLIIPILTLITTHLTGITATILIPNQFRCL